MFYNIGFFPERVRSPQYFAHAIIGGERQTVCFSVLADLSRPASFMLPGCLYSGRARIVCGTLQA